MRFHFILIKLILYANMPNNASLQLETVTFWFTKVTTSGVTFVKHVSITIYHV